MNNGLPSKSSTAALALADTQDALTELQHELLSGSPNRARRKELESEIANHRETISRLSKELNQCEH
ncbi:MAG: hypothetical protein HZB26_07295 [Candidatus Hydrogenedentes bacterium]|nr:hypothetical protein [Candidatus Hydrogenedentota bacterium]